VLRLFFTFLLFQAVTSLNAAQNPRAEHGVIDLSHYNDSAPLKLDGAWLFKWKKFDSNILNDPQSSIIEVPGNWSKYSGAKFGQNIGFCTYGLRIRLPKSSHDWALLIPTINSAYRLYVDGELVSQSGIPTENISMVPSAKPHSIHISGKGKEVQLVLQVSNYHFISGGIWTSILFGSSEVIEREQKKEFLISAFLMGSLIIMGLYHLALFFFWKKDKSPLYFGIVCISLGLRESFGGPAFFYSLFPEINYAFSLKLLYSCFPIGMLFFILFFCSIYIKHSRLVRNVGRVLCVAFLLLIVCTPNTVFGLFLPLMSLVFILEIGHLLFLSIKGRQIPRIQNMLLLVGITVLILCVINDLLFDSGVVQTYFLLPFGFFIFTLCQAILLAIRFSNAFQTSERLSLALIRTEELKKIEEFKNRFFANITHEFRTPLSLIIGPIERLVKEENTTPFVKNTLKTVHRNAFNLLRLINQLLDIAKIESGNMKVAKTRGDFNVFFSQLLDGFKFNADDKGIELNLIPIDTTQDYIFDSEKFEKIGYNLLSNAIKFTNTGGSITLKLSMDGMKLNLEVIDTGIGIEEIQLNDIFERFAQVDSPASKGGTGIGLSLVKELIILLGGQITVNSKIGKGTHFLVTLPFEAIDYNTATLTPAIHTPESTYTFFGSSPIESTRDLHCILLVEDNEELLAFNEEILSGLYKVITARNGAEAWKVCNEELPDLVISDVMMPEMDGIELCKAIKSNTATDHIGVILLTAKAGIESKIEGLANKANDYLTKPFHLEELILRIQNFLDYQQLLRNASRNDLTDSNPAFTIEKNNPFLVKLYDEIDKNLDNSNLSVDELASTLAVSTRTLNRKLTSLIGLSAIEIIKNFRLKKALELLASGHNVTETGYMVGFESPSYFGQCFKETFSITPSAYRQKNNFN
jgi:signal transduction histidine kinase/DNA-binding response OmpR family regulator